MAGSRHPLIPLFPGRFISKRLVEAFGFAVGLTFFLVPALMTIAARLFLALLFLQSAHLNAQDRMPPIPAEKQTDTQKIAVADYKDIRKVDLTAPPWSVLERVPDLVVPSLQLRLHKSER